MGRNFIVTQLFRPFAQRAVTSDLVMLDRLSCTNQASVKRSTLGFFDQAFAFLDKPDHMERLLRETICLVVRHEL